MHHTHFQHPPSFVYSCICVFVYLRICVFAYLRICVFVLADALPAAFRPISAHTEICLNTNFSCAIPAKRPHLVLVD